MDARRSIEVTLAISCKYWVDLKNKKAKGVVLLILYWNVLAQLPISSLDLTYIHGT